jgi:hypothetical protein
MSNREITSLGIRFIGIYSLVQYFPVILHLFSIASLWTSNETYSWVSTMEPIGSVAIFVLFFGLCLLMIFKPGVLAVLLCREDVTIVPAESFSLLDIQRLAFSIIGLLLIVKALPHAAGLLFQYQLLQTQFKDMPYPSMMPNLISWTVQILIGLFLFFRSQLLVNLWAQSQGGKNPQA